MKLLKIISLTTLFVLLAVVIFFLLIPKAPQPPSEQECGNGWCETEEDLFSCSEDCAPNQPITFWGHMRLIKQCIIKYKFGCSALKELIFVIVLITSTISIFIIGGKYGQRIRRA